ncbi:MAG: glycosyltransferase family 2 protein [Candidatus Dojkabacteria bacterium]
MDKPLVSIITPVYNDGKFLDESLRSSLAQTYPNFEVIVVNDGSTDEFTLDYLSKINDPKVKVINKENGGLPSARNAALVEAKGEFFLPLDSDDKIEPTMIEKTIALMTDEKTAVVYTNQIYFGDENKPMPMLDYNPQEELVINHISVCSLIRRKAYEDVKTKNGFGYNENMTKGAEDWDFWINLQELGWDFKVVHEPLFLYRKRSGSATAKALTRYDFVMKQLMENHKEIYAKNYDYVIPKLQSLYMDREMSVTNLKKETQSPVWLLKRFLKSIFGQN